MKKIIILSGILAMVFASCRTSTSSLKTNDDSVAYALGMNMGELLKNFDSTLNINLVVSGMKDYLKGNGTFEREKINEILTGYYMVSLPLKNKAISEKFLADIEKNNKSIQKTESGLLYEIIEAGDPDIKATAEGDKVTVKYRGTLMSGKEYSKDSVDIHIGQVIKGWSEGVQLIGKGGHIKLWIPSELAYGEAGNPPAIPGNNAILLDMQLIDVVPVTDSLNLSNPN